MEYFVEILVGYSWEIAWFALGGMSLVLCLLYFFRWRDYGLVRKPLTENKDEGGGDALPRVSIVVPYGEGQGELAASALPEFLKTDYPDFEVVATNCSADRDASEMLLRVCQLHRRLRSTGIPSTMQDKGRAWLGVTLGVRAAYGEWIVILSPDVRPSSPDWLRRMVRQARERDMDVVQAYANYADEGTRLSRRAVYSRLCRQLMRLRASRKGVSIGSEPVGVLMRKDFFLAHCHSPRILREPFGALDLMLDGQPAAGRLSQMLTPETTLLQTLPPRELLAGLRHVGRRIRRSRTPRARLYGLRAGLARVLLWLHLLTAAAYVGFRVWTALLAQAYPLISLVPDAVFLLLFLVALLLPALLLRRSCRRLGERTFGLYPYFADLLGR